jgi:flavodoxin
MKALIVYDSVFGNTEKIAQAMGEALAAHGEVELRRVSDAQPGQLAGMDLLLVGSPTRAFRPTPAAVAFLKRVSAGALSGVKGAAFDTRMPIEQAPAILRFLVGIFGYAAKPLAARLQKAGGALACPPEGFFVTGTEGPLKEGELERAAAWAKAAAGQAQGV